MASSSEKTFTEISSSNNGGSFYSASSTPLSSPDFQFSSRPSLSSGDDAMSFAADLFLDGKIRSLRLFSGDLPPPEKSKSGGVRADVVRSVSAKEARSEGEKARRSWRWEYVKEMMYRSRSEGRGGRMVKEEEKKTVGRRRNNGGGGGFVSLHEMHYTEKRAQAEEMKRKTYLPYRQGLLGCLGFTWRSYGAIHGFSRAFTQTSVFSR